MEIIALEGNVYVLISFLKKYGINEQSIHNQLSRNRKALTKHYVHFFDESDRRVAWIRYNSISHSMVVKHNLPNEFELLKIIETEKLDKIDQLISLKFQFSVEKGFKQFLKYYHGYFYEIDVIHEFARNHSVFDQIQQMRSVNIDINKIFQHYKNLDQMVFETTSLNSFYRKLKEFEERGHEALIHKSKGKTKNNRKLTQAHIDKIIDLYKSKSQWSYRVIHEKLNQWAILNGYSEVSVSSIKNILADKYIQNQCKPSRNGAEWIKTNLQPFRLREDPTANFELWQLDGSRFQFPYLTEDGKIAFLIFFVVLDVHSRKIIGYSSGKTENHILVKEALSMAVQETGFLPSEIIRDNGGCFRDKKYQKLEEYISAFGTNIRRHIPGNPNDKGHVESFFSVFQTTVCKGEYGYVGEGITSKRESGRPARSVILETTQRKNLRTKLELENLLRKLILQYNAQSTNPLKKSPEDKFSIAKNCPYSIRISENDFALMFWNRVQEYHVRKSMILLTEGSFRNKQFQYLIEDDELILKLNGTCVIVCYNKSDRNRVKLFDENERFIVELKYSQPVKIVHRNKELKPSVSFTKDLDEFNQNIELEDIMIHKKHHLFKAAGTLDVLFLKTKGNE